MPDRQLDKLTQGSSKEVHTRIKKSRSNVTPIFIFYERLKLEL